MNRRTLSRLAVCALAAPLLCVPLVATGPPAAAAPTCYRTANLSTGAYGPVPVPSTGTTAASTSCVMGRGATSAAVRRLQQTLNKCHDERLAEDGIYGAATEAAVTRAQREGGVARDGVYGPVTRDVIGWWTGGYHSNGEPVCGQVDGPGGA